MKKEIDLEEAFERGYFHDIYVEALMLKSALETAKNALEFLSAPREVNLDRTTIARQALAKLEDSKLEK